MNLLKKLQLITEPSRFEIVKILLETKTHGQELCVNEIASQIDSTPSSVSHHFAKLEQAGIVTSFKEGRRVCYCLAKTEFTAKLEQIFKILST